MEITSTVLQERTAVQTSILNTHYKRQWHANSVLYVLRGCYRFIGLSLEVVNAVVVVLQDHMRYILLVTKLVVAQQTHCGTQCIRT